MDMKILIIDDEKSIRLALKGTISTSQPPENHLSAA